MYLTQQQISMLCPNCALFDPPIVFHVFERCHRCPIVNELRGQWEAEGVADGLGIGPSSPAKRSQAVERSFQDHARIVEGYEPGVEDRVACHHVLRGGKETGGEDPSSGP